MDVEQVQPKIEESEYGSVSQNVKKLRVGNGKWEVDANALRLRDADGNVIIYIGED